MKQAISFSLIACLSLCLSVPGWSAPIRSVGGTLLAQADEGEEEDSDLFGEGEDEEEADLKRAEIERKKREEEERKAAEVARRTALKKQKVKERRIANEKAKELDTLREAQADSTEYTIDPSSVEMVVELDPAGYGFRQRNHRMQLWVDADLVMRGRGMLNYEYRFFDHLSVGIRSGVDYSKMSLYSGFREHAGKPIPEQFTVLAGMFSKWRVTEWYMRSAIFLEPSVLVGHMWQTLVTSKTSHFVFRPGLFLGFDSVFDSGFAFTTRVGAEVPFDFGSEDRVNEVVAPLLLVGFGFAI